MFFKEVEKHFLNKQTFGKQMRIRTDLDPQDWTQHTSVSDPYSLNPDPDPAKNLNPDPEGPPIRIRIQAIS